MSLQVSLGVRARIPVRVGGELPRGTSVMDRSEWSREILLVSPRALRWFVLVSAISFALLTLSVRDERLGWLTPIGFLGTAITLPVVIKTTAVLLNRRFGRTFAAVAHGLGFGASVIGAAATA